MRQVTAIASIATALLIGAGGLSADDKPQRRATPRLELDLAFQLRFDWTAGSDNPDNRIKQLFVEHGDFEIGLHATDWLALRTHVAAGAVRPPLPGRNAWFRGFAMYIEELFVELDFEGVGLRAGKFNPAFAIAHDEKLLGAMGAVGFSQAYQLTEMLGFGVSVRPNLNRHGLGQHELSAQFFFADTTFLNHSFFTTPRATDASFGRLSDRRFGDGGLANTNRPDNVALALTGTGFDVLPDLTYTLGFQLLRASPAGLAAGTESRDETGYSAALRYPFTAALWGTETKISPLAEWVHLRNPGGNPGIANYYTLGIGIEAGLWELWLSGTLRDTVAVPGVPDARDRLFALSLDRGVTDWLRLGIGYRYQRVNRINDHIVGLRLWLSDHMEIALR